MRVAFIIDGFNLYHSIRDAEKLVPHRPQRWLDLESVCRSYLHHFGRSATLEGIYYFSALARHLAATNDGIESRQQAYIDAIASTGVQVTLGQFKARRKFIPLRYCKLRIRLFRRHISLPVPGCSLVFDRAEEKETDVAIAAKLFELLHLKAVDAVVLVSGDTDLLPAIRTAAALFPATQIAVMFPYNRHNAELKRAVRRSFKIAKEQYSKHQLPDPIVLANGYTIRKPGRW